MPLFRRKSKEPPASVEHAVILHLPLSGDEFGTADEREDVFALEDRIIEAVAPIGGDHDGHEFGAGEAVLYTYGRDANELFDAIGSCFGAFPIRPGAYAIKRFGPAADPGSAEERLELA
ncbi:MAG: hypothetical protein ACJ744_00760 [Gaiellaceae bacterium]